MDKNKQYFIDTISAFLNGNKIEYSPDIYYDEVYRLADIHDVAGIVARQIMDFDKDKSKNINCYSKFKQQLGYTVIDFEKKKRLLNMIKADFNANGIDFLPVKGAVIRTLYSVPELRTSGDSDIYFRQKDYERVKQIYLDKGISFEVINPHEIVFKVNGEMIELHCENDYDNDYFSDIFSIAEKIGEHEYILKNEDQLIYVLCHIAHHFNHCGAGIRMFMDVDVLIRHIDGFDCEGFFEKCRDIGIESLAKAVFSLCKIWFNTPVKAGFDFSDGDLLTIFENTVIDGGSFGFEARHLGEYYINKGIGKNGKNNIIAKIRALSHLLFPSTDVLKNNYEYCRKHKILIPFAWFNRLFDGLFKRNTNSVNTVKDIMLSGASSEDYKKLMQELDINEK